MAAKPARGPHLLLTTVETFSSIVSQQGWRAGLKVHTVVVDEIHSLAENKRGTLLSLAMERLEALVAEPFSRLGLSATAHPPQAVAELLCGDRSCAVASVDVKRAHRLEIAVPESKLPPSGHSPYRVAYLVADLVRQKRCTLAFTITRSAAERLAVALKVLLPEQEDRIAVHHSSIERTERLAIEDGLKRGEFRAVVCSSSLELGVDFEHVDQVLLIGAPHGVSSALQRLGRSGHRVDGVAEGVIVPVTLPDLLESIAVRDAARGGRLDELRIPVAPLDVLAQALLGMSIEREWGADEAFEAVRRAGPYRDPERAAFDSILHYLAGGGRVLGSYDQYGKIVIDNGRFRVASRKVAKDYYHNIGTISQEFQIQIFTRSGRHLGAVGETFLSSLEPDQAFSIGGKPFRVKQIIQNRAVVEPARGEAFITPRWTGNKMPLTLRVAREEIRLRRALRNACSEGGAAACRRMLEKQWRLGAREAALAAEFVARHAQAAPVPVEDPVQVERVDERRRTYWIFHVLAGRDANHALSWVLAHRLRDVGSIVANFDDRTFLLAVDRRKAPNAEELRGAFAPEGWLEDLHTILRSTETLGRDFWHVAETGQLLRRRTFQGAAPAKSSSWSGAVLYKTFLEYEPDHPLMQETLREYLEDRLDVHRAIAEAARIYTVGWEVFEHPRPSPFALPIYAASNASTLLAQDPARALEDLAERLYESWEGDSLVQCFTQTDLY